MVVIKKLTVSVCSSGGRNCFGRITSYHRGGRGLRRYRLLPTRFFKLCAVVVSFTYGNFRRSSLALLRYDNGCLGYFYRFIGFSEGSVVCFRSGFFFPVRFGFGSELRNFTLGSSLVCLENYPGSGFGVARSAGTFARLLKRFDEYYLVRLPSGKLRIFSSFCSSFKGRMFGVRFKFFKFVRAGQRRKLGIRPSVRGVAMNPVDHPHGGGEGRTSGGRPSSTPWGRPTKGYTTASKNFLKDKFVTFLFRNKSLIKKRKSRKRR